MQKTTNYKLPKWEKADRILMDDFNGLTETLDTALHGVAVSAEAAQAAADSEATARENADAALRTAVDGKQAKLTGAATSIAASNLTASRALVSDANGKVAVSAVTAAELGYLDGVTSAVQTQLNGKAASSHTHAQSAITGLTAALAAKGNCRIATGSYTGTGEYGADHPNTLTLDFAPQIVFVDVRAVSPYNSIPQYYIFLRGTSSGYSNGSNTALKVSWSGNSLSWYYPNTDNNGAKFQHNLARTYYYIALG